MADRTQLVHELGGVLVKNPNLTPEGWVSVALVAVLTNSSAGLTGYCYLTDSSYRPCSPRDPQVLRVLRELRDAMALADRKKPWVACLIQILRATGEINIEFEYDNPDRWAITADTYTTRPEELRPRPKQA